MIRTFAAALATTTCIVAIATPAAAQTREFDVPAGSLRTALDAFIRQSGRQLIYRGDVRSARSPGVRGARTAEDALNAILGGSGFVARADRSGAFAIVKAGNGDAADVAADEPAEGGSGQDIVVTGTNIRGSGPIGSPLTIVTREDIEKSGHGRIEDYLETVTSNFSGTTSEDSTLNFSSDQNLARGQGIDLRGLGSGSTLVLVNGRRQAPGGLVGGFVDIASIPAQAVERIEILTDGASALYGSDAVGGVVNFVLRRDYEGLETSLRIANIDSGIDELQASVTGGISWDGGNLIAGYVYSRRKALYLQDRPYGRLNLNYTSLGGFDFRAIEASPGTIQRFGEPSYAIPAGQDGTSLTVAQLVPGVNYRDAVTGVFALPDQELHSVFASISHDLTDGIRLFADGRYGRRRMHLENGADYLTLDVPSSNPVYVNPYGDTDPVSVGYDFRGILGLIEQNATTTTYNFTGGVDVELGGRWQLKLTGSYARERNWFENINNLDYGAVFGCLSGTATPAECPGRPLNLFGDGRANDPVTVAFIRGRFDGASTASLTNVTALIDGPLFRLPAGEVKFAVGADYRNDTLDKTESYKDSGMIFAGTPIDASRRVWAAFGELAVPLIGNDSKTILEASFAGRYEDYSDFGSTFKPKIGVNIWAVDGLGIRGSWSTSFRAPRFSEQAGSGSSGFYDFPDPQSPTGTTPILYIANEPVPDLGPETADSWTVGFDAKPRFLPGLTASATYFQLNYSNKIVDLAISNPFAAPAAYASIITRNPTQAQIDTVCNRPDYFGGCPAPADVGAILDLRVRNLSVVKVRGIDFMLAYNVQRSFGDLTFGVSGTRLFRHSLAISDTDTPVNVVNTVANPLKLRLRGTAAWSHQGWSFNAGVNFANAYDDPASNRTVDSWTTVDASIGYEFKGDGLSKGLLLRLAATNLFDAPPPFANQLWGFDGANANWTGRSVSLTVTKKW